MKLKEFFTSPKMSLVLFAVALLLLSFSGIGGTRAALTYFSEDYAGRVQMYDIGVSLVENDSKISWRDYSGKGDGEWKEAKGGLLSNLLAEDESLKIGKAYREELSVENSGTINQYVRVTLYRYWTDKEGNKLQDVAPSLIDLHLVNLDSDWILDTSSTTEERTVLYYNKLLESGQTTPILSDTLTIDSMVASKVTQETYTDGEYTVMTVTYDYDGLQFVVEAQVDAVQEHNAEAAILSAWGKHVTVNNQVLSLQEGESHE